MLSSDPHAWLRPFYADLRSHPAFASFAPSLQFQQLVQAVEREHPSKAATLREWSAAAQHGLLLHLASMFDQKESAAPFHMWSVHKGRSAVTMRRGVLAFGLIVDTAVTAAGGTAERAAAIIMLEFCFRARDAARMASDGSWASLATDTRC